MAGLRRQNRLSAALLADRGRRGARLRQAPVRQYGVTIDQYHLPSGAQKLTLQPLPTQSNEHRFGPVQAATGVDAGALFRFAASDGAAVKATVSAATAPSIRIFVIEVMSTASLSESADLYTALRWQQGLLDAIHPSG